MDDFIILSPDKDELRRWLADIEVFLRDELRFALNPKTAILAAKNGIDFVGYKHRATHRKVRPDSIKRVRVFTLCTLSFLFAISIKKKFSRGLKPLVGFHSKTYPPLLLLTISKFSREKFFLVYLVAKISP